jgi:hypothetical protein
MPRSPTTPPKSDEVLMLEPHNSRQGKSKEVGANVKTGTEINKVVQHMERLENMGVCS